MDESVEVTEENLQTIPIDQQNNYTRINKKETASGIEKNEQAEEITNKPCHKRVWDWWCGVNATHSFLIGNIIVILIAKAYPPLGAIHLYPQITATWIAVMFIFGKFTQMHSIINL